MDENAITLSGFIMLRFGLQKNKSLIYLPTPSNDISLANGPKDRNQFTLGDVMKDIDELVYKNMLKQRGEIELFDYEEEEPQSQIIEKTVPTSTSSTNLMKSSSARLESTNRVSQAEIKTETKPPASSSADRIPLPSKPPPPKPPAKPTPSGGRKPKPPGIDTARASALFGQLNDFMANELTPEEIAQRKLKK